MSHDGGQTWGERRIVAADPDERVFYWDQRIAIHPATGELVAMFWTHNRETGADLDNHIAWSDGVHRHWSLPVPAGWLGQHCQPLSLGGEWLAAIHTERTVPGGIIVRLSNDYGRTWQAEPAVKIYEPPSERGDSPTSFEQFWQSMMTWPFGHPRAVVTSEGDILAAWYAGSNDVIGMQWARIATDNRA